MTRLPTFDDIFAVMSATSVGNSAARFAIAVNLDRRPGQRQEALRLSGTE
jgi:hypothetical protein